MDLGLAFKDGNLYNIAKYTSLQIRNNLVDLQVTPAQEREEVNLTKIEALEKEIKEKVSRLEHPQRFLVYRGRIRLKTSNLDSIKNLGWWNVFNWL